MRRPVLLLLVAAAALALRGPRASGEDIGSRPDPVGPDRLLLRHLTAHLPTPREAAGRAGDLSGGRGASSLERLQLSLLRRGLDRARTSPRSAAPGSDGQGGERGERWSQAAVQLSEALRALGEAGAARTVLTEAVSTRTDDPVLLRGLAEDRMEAAEWAEAESTLETLVRLRPDDSEAHADLARARLPLGRRGEAEAAVATALRLDPDCAQARRVLGRLREWDEDWEGALAEYEAVARLRPRWHIAHADRGIALYRLDRNVEAESALKLAVALGDESWITSVKLASILWRLGKPEEGRRTAGTLLERDPDHPEANREMGLCLYRMGRAEPTLMDGGATRYLEKAAALGDLLARRWIGRIQFTLGQYEQAERALSLAIEQDPDDARSHVWLGQALAAQDHDYFALDSFRRALEIDPDDWWWAHLDLAELLDEIGLPGSALPHYRRFLLGTDLGDDDRADIEARVRELESE